VERRGTHVEPPSVYVESRWEYRELVRDAEASALPTEIDLNALGADGWELVGVAAQGAQVHFYFKRERPR
jgi:hypothetical protein